MVPNTPSSSSKAILTNNRPTVSAKDIYREVLWL